MTEPASPDVRISKNPQIQDRVDEELIKLHKEIPQAPLSPLNKLARDNVAKEIRIERLRKESNKGKENSVIDHLTQLPNRRWFDNELAIKIGHAERRNEAFWVIVLDIDRFKWINDQYGHLVGDKILKTISSLKTRQGEPIARFGGEEFVQILENDMGENGLSELINRYLKDFKEKTSLILQKAQWKDDGNPQVKSATLSFGISKFEKGLTSEELIRRTDEALREAKRTGKNSACIAGVVGNEISFRKL